MGKEANRNYKYITFGETRRRLNLLIKFHELVKIYFDNSKLNMISGNYIEEGEAREARIAIDSILYKAYRIIRLANIKTYTLSSSSLAIRGSGQNIDLILNIFNLAKNNIPPEAAIDYIERAIDVYNVNYLRKKRILLYITIALALGIISVVLFIHTNKVPEGPLSVYQTEGITDSQRIKQFDKTSQESGTANRVETGSASKRDFVLEESYKNVSSINKDAEETIADDQYTSQSIYTIQTGSFLTIERAQKQFDSLVEMFTMGDLAYLRIEKVDKYYSVRLGKFQDYTNTGKLLHKIKPHFSSSIIMKAHIKKGRIISLHKDPVSSQNKITLTFNQ